jgi:hypothetical protein
LRAQVYLSISLNTGTRSYMLEDKNGCGLAGVECMEFVRLDGMARDEFNCCIAIMGIRISIGDLRARGVRGVCIG